MAETQATTVPTGTPASTEAQQKEAKVRQNMVAGMTNGPPATPPPKPQEERNMQLPPMRMQSREFANNDHVVTIESNWTMEDVLKPIFWSSTWQKMRKYDRVAVRVDDGSWYAELLVQQVGTGYAFVRPTLFINLMDDGSASAQAPPAIEGFSVRELGPFKKWCVVRTADSTVMKEKCESKRDAEQWLHDYQVQQARSTGAN